VPVACGRLCLCLCLWFMSLVPVFFFFLFSLPVKITGNATPVKRGYY
jgi:hypothetical protein